MVRYSAPSLAHLLAQRMVPLLEPQNSSVMDAQMGESKRAMTKE